MDLKSFQKMLGDKVKELMKDKVNIKFVKRKINNSQTVFVMIIEQDKAISEVNIEGLYLMYQDRDNIEEVARLAVIMSQEKQEDLHLDPPEVLLDWNEMKSRIMYRLINRKWNRERLKKLPHKEFLDLAVVFYMISGTSKKYRVSMEVTEKFRQAWNVDIETLWNAAMENTPRKYPEKVESFAAIADRLRRKKGLLEETFSAASGGKCVPERDRQKEKHIYTLTNTFGCDGASVIFYPGVLKGISKKVDSDLYLVMDSIDSAIVFPANGQHDIRELYALLNNINAAQVSENKLTEHIYRYHKDTGEITITDNKESDKGEAKPWVEDKWTLKNLQKLSKRILRKE